MFLFVSSSSYFVQELNSSCKIRRGHYAEYLCEIVLNLDQWVRCHFKMLLYLALVANLLSGVEPFVQFWYRVLSGSFL